ncbi:hypothetical protein UA08_03746 [Talaromyces atroroseus]|uniref:Uncharacterized protein n=1 Tax=Talaromyces atroroseus TaxID=1441469 RepID=A0A225APB9_TALAT|nr:hypothetical protein UA08_03746 [Talaromyces atroroseus]OKL61323.1 hypothetical protein UA08_03746 [Talaromyces atroroseus]
MPSNFEQSQRRISVGTLTEKLNAHTLDHSGTRAHSAYEPPHSPLSPTSFSFSVTKDPSSSRASMHTLLTPPGEYEDEGYDEQLNPAWESYHHAPSPTSMPVEHDNLYLHPPAEVSHRFARQPSLRSQRQQMSRAQCNIDVLKLALLAENFTRRTSESPVLSDDECHPSSLPLEASPHTLRRSSMKPRVTSGSSATGTLRCRSRAPADASMMRRRSTSSAGTFASSTRIAKPRPRDLHTKRSEQSLRRKSLVCATLASTSTTRSS